MSSALSLTRERLEEKYGEQGRVASEALTHWLSGELPFSHTDILEKHLGDAHVDLLFDAFWQLLPFGTGGRRGRVGYGPNRVNETTVAMTVQGHSNYLRRELGDGDLRVVIANDVRVFRDLASTYTFLGDAHPLLGVSSRSLGKLACSIYAGNGITAYFEDPEHDGAVLSTPELSFLIVDLGAQGGINLSASHNPPDDNGIKTYDGFGSQPIAPEDQRLIDIMADASAVKTMPFQEALAQGLVEPVPGDRHATYVDLYVDLYGDAWKPVDDHAITFTPLCGCGIRTVGAVLERLGFPVLVPQDQLADGRFSVIPFRAPNPEVPQATEPARAFADSQGSEAVLSSDPDADRVGLEIKLSDGNWFHFDGNQIAAILGYYLMLDPEGPQRRGLVIETLVTTKILGRIVEEAGDSKIIDDLLVGFKYVADVLKRLDAGESYGNVTGGAEQLVLAAEESHGVIMLPGIRDKDASPAAMYLAALHQRLRTQGKTLLDYYVGILEHLGAYDNLNRSIVMLGADGVLKRDEIMSSLRASLPSEIAGQRVVKILDFWDEEVFGPFVSESDRLPRNVLQIQTDAFVVTIRPSGTEPKLKLYCQLLPEAGAPRGHGRALLDQVRARSEKVARQIYGDLLDFIGIRLGPAALLLPDIVDLDRKVEFGEKTVPALRDALSQQPDLDALLDWLGKAVAPMTPGTDALPAVREAVAHLCSLWRNDLDSPLLDALSAWTTR